ncbi:hypothetical protein WA1_03180 [Scytonema hofmannii PCC 7110]|uniref:Uncharacterized protein n=1 Tax=Scytonema hofmannii PCC 7110 TaxID=128403 RepID=A0A139XHI0_9CYAN|nr:hypothetical protein WA1_03180 [Scytonema hofmannii PCC 7110]
MLANGYSQEIIDQIYQIIDSWLVLTFHSVQASEHFVNVVDRATAIARYSTLILVIRNFILFILKGLYFRNKPFNMVVFTPSYLA